MEEKLLDLKTRLAEVADLQQAAAVLIWDQETYMPPGGAEARAMQMGTLSGLAHQKATDDAVGALLDDLSAALNGTDADSDEGALVRVTQREYQKLARTPRELVVELAQTLPLSMEAWKKARETDDFATFLPYLEKVIELREWQIEVLGPAESGDPYDVLLDDYEPGLTTATIDSVYDALHGPLVELVEGISAHQDRVDRSVLLGDFSEEKQMAFSREVAEALGYDFSRGRIDVSAHPFTINFGRDDVRITTRFDAADPISAIMSTIHEAGHAIYEQNIAASLSRTGLDSGAGMATHESQSRFYENVLGRSRAFWDV
ncbi:MAG: carboxypeptidase M32, partial [Anaerolineae bacterium]